MSEKKPVVILFGTGNGGKNGYKHLKRRCRIIGFCDNDLQKQKQLFFGLPVYAPEALPNLDFDRVIICSMYHDQILEQLTLRVNIPYEKIDLLDPDVLNYGSGSPFGCLIAAALLTAGFGYLAYRLNNWLFG